MNNNDLIRLLNERDESALSHISADYGRILKGLAQRIVGSQADAEECFNDVLLEIWNTIPPAEPASVSAYACMLTRRTAIDRVRRNTADKRGGGELYTSIDELSEVLSDQEQVDDDALRCTINDFLSQLSRTDRTLFMGRYFGAESVSRLAARCGMSANAAAVRLSRIKERLRDHLLKQGVTV